MVFNEIFIVFRFLGYLPERSLVLRREGKKESE